MAEVEPPGLQLIDGAAMGVDDAPLRRGAEGAALAATRAARPVLDRLDRTERSRIEAVVVTHPHPDTQCVADIAHRTAAGLSLAPGARVPVADMDAGGLFAALHVAGAMATRPEAAVLVVSFGAGHVGSPVGVFLLARRQGMACRPMPPMQTACAPDAEIAEAASACGGALASMLASGGVSRRSVRRAASPGLDRVEAASILREAGLSHVLAPSFDTRLATATTMETAFAEAAGCPPSGLTLLWTRSRRDGCLSACLLGGEPR